MNQTPWTPKFRLGNRRFLTKRLWGDGNRPPYYHHGLFTTIRQATLAHSGEAKQSRVLFQEASTYDQDSLIEFLKTLHLTSMRTSFTSALERIQKTAPPGADLTSWRY